MKYEKQREKLIELIVNAKRADPETESFTEFLADFLLGYGVFVPLDDYDLDRLRELVEADRDGRCVVLPCRLWDILWTYCNYPIRKIYSFTVTGISTINGRTMLNTDILGVIDSGDVGKTVFLTREAAEDALKGERNA